MSKLQLLYEKFMKVAFIFSVVFFVLFLIDLFAAMVSGAFDCAGSTLCQLRDGYSFYSFTLYPLGIGTLVFLVTGRIFYSFAHKESDLLTVNDYRKSIVVAEEDTISRDELYEKLGRRKRKDPNAVNVWVRVGRNIKAFFGAIGEKVKNKVDTSKQKSSEKKELQAETKRIKEEQAERERTLKVHSKLNKTGLIIKVSEQTSLSQNDSRLFVNTLLDIIKQSVIAEEEVKIAKFGKFSKVHIEEHTEVDPDSGAELKIEEQNDVEFTAFKQFLSKFEGNEDYDQVEEIEEESEPVVEEQPKPVVEEEPAAVVEEESEPVVEEQPAPVVEEEPAPVVEEEPAPVVKEEPAPVVEEEPEPVVEEEPKPQIKQQSMELEDKSVVSEAQPEESKEVKPAATKKAASAKQITKTKKQFIEMMDETTDLSKNKANKFLKYFAEVVKEQLALRNEVELPGIGFFTTIEMPAKEAVNPQTGEKIIVPSHFQVRLRFDDDFKDKMN